MINETEDIYLLRFRYGRTIEIWTAYQTFLNQEVEAGKTKSCNDNEVVSQVTHTLLLTFYSFVYSLFDASGTNFISATKNIIPHLSDEAKQIRDELITFWTTVENPIKIIRHNIGFHGGQHLKSHEKGYDALLKIHPFSAEYILNQLAIFFVELDNLIPPSENYHYHIDPKQKEFLLKKSKELKNEIEEMPLDQYFKKIMQLMTDKNAR